MKSIDRLYIYLENKGIKPTRFEKSIGFSNGYISAIKKRNADMGESILRKIIEYFQEINPTWLLTGEGEMIKENISSEKAVSIPPTESELTKRINHLEKINEILLDKIRSLEEENKNQKDSLDTYNKKVGA